MSNSLKTTYLTVKDHSKSGEIFQLLHNEELDMLETVPQPALHKLGDYYESQDYISHTDAKRNLFEKAYHFAKSIALKQKLKLINSFQYEDKFLLDVGCGTGDFLQIAKGNGWAVLGIEPNVQARIIANHKTDNSVFGVEKIKQLDHHTFDVITLWHVLEHLPNLDDEISAIVPLLKPEGTLIIAVPNYKSYDAKYYHEFWAAFDAPRHLWHFSQTSILKLMAKSHMKVTKILPMKFDAFYVSLLSEKYKTGKLNPIRAFWIGMKSNIKAGQTKEYSSLIYMINRNKNQ